MNNIWNLLPAGVATRAKAIVAVIGAVAYVVVSYVPDLQSNHYVAIVIAVLTAFGVWGVPNASAKSKAGGA